MSNVWVILGWSPINWTSRFHGYGAKSITMVKVEIEFVDPEELTCTRASRSSTVVEVDLWKYYRASKCKHRDHCPGRTIETVRLSNGLELASFEAKVRPWRTEIAEFRLRTEKQARGKLSASFNCSNSTSIKSVFTKHSYHFNCYSWLLFALETWCMYEERWWWLKPEISSFTKLNVLYKYRRRRLDRGSSCG